MALPAGVVAAAITPLLDGSRDIDLESLLALTDWLAKSGVAGVALFGATGEFPHFGIEDRARVTNRVIAQSRVPIIVNVTHSTLGGALELAEEAARDGAAAVMVQPPFYFRYSDDEVRSFLMGFVTRLHSRVPVLLYHLPAFNNGIAAHVSTQFLKLGLAAGIKDSSGDLAMLEALRQAHAEKAFHWIVGHDGVLWEGRQAGASALISGCACAVPELSVALWSGAEELRPRLNQFLDWIGDFPGPNGVREAVELRGLKTGGPANPYSPQLDQRAKQFRDWFSEWWPQVAKECQAHAT